MADDIHTMEDGTQLVFPPGWTDDQKKAYLGRSGIQDQVNKVFTTPSDAGDRTGGKIIPPVEGTPGPAIQYRGAMREPGIAATQFLRGAASPFALPGDIATAVNTLGAGIPYEIAPALKALPTSQSLDRMFDSITRGLQPEGFWENELAGALRGVGEGTMALLGARSPVVAYSRYPWARAGSFTQNALTGAASGLASTAVEQGMQYEGMNPDQNFSFAPLAPPVAGALAGLVTGGGISHFIATPYERAVRNLGGNIQRGRPYENDAGNILRNDLTSTVANTPQTISNMGAGGLYGTDLEQRAFKALTDPNASGTEIKNLALSEPQIASVLRDEQPTAMNAVGASHIANATAADDWMRLHADTKAALVPDPIDRRIIENTFRGGVLPGPQGFMARVKAAGIREGRHVLTGVTAGVGVDAAHYFMDMAHNDPSLMGSLKLMGAVALPTYLTTRFLMGTRVGRQVLLGGAVGMGPGSNLAPFNLARPGMEYQGEVPR